MLEVIKGRNHGQWWPLRDQNIHKASFVCPECDIRAYLIDHTIDENGIVKPSVLCDCGFHRDLKLLGWKEYIKLQGV